MAEKYLNKEGLLYSEENGELVSIEEDIRASIEEIKIPPEQTELPPYLFSGCEALKKVYMPDTLKGFPEGLFQGCVSIEDIPFRAGIDEIKPNTFESCASLKSIVFPDTINAIRSRACADCTNLETVVLPPRMYALADDAFDGCPNIHNIRIDSENKLFYLSDKDGCLYERNVEGDDILKIKLNRVEGITVGFYKDNVDEDSDSFYTNEDVEEDDETFSNEIDNSNNGECKMEESNVDNMLADIMGEEKERDTISNEIGVSDQESAVLSEMMDVMSDSSMNKPSSFTTDDLVNIATDEPPVQKLDKNRDLENLDKKTQTLIDSVANNKIILCEPTGPSPESIDLIVVSEREEFSDKLIECAKKIAEIQDLRRIIMISGLPVENQEFMQFYTHYVDLKNVVVACLSESPDDLSDYCKVICEQSRVGLSKDIITDQRKHISVKNNNLIKLIVRDVD